MSYRIPISLRARWDRAIFFIAFNDDPSDMSYLNICSYITTVLTADIFDVHIEKVARAVLKLRRAEGVEYARLATN